MRTFIYLTFLLCVLFFTTGPAGLEAFDLTGTPEIPENSGEYGFWLELMNDGGGLAFVDEWDDGRTFGLHAGTVLFSNLYVHFGYSALTDRGEAGTDSVRIDTADLSVGYRFAKLNRPPFFLELTGGVGGRFYGDILGETIQRNWHFLMDVERPIPLGYEGPGSVVPYGYGVLSLGVSDPVRFDITSRNVFLLNGIFRFSLEWKYGKWWEYSHAWLSLQYYGSAGRSEYDTVNYTSGREEGPWAHAGMRVGRFRFESSYNLLSGISFGTLGWQSFLGGPDSGPVRSRAVGEEEGTQSLEFSKPFLSTAFIIQVRFAPKGFFSRGLFLERSAVLFEWQTGWDGIYDSVSRAERYQQFLLGWDATLLKPKRGFFVSPFANLCLGVRSESVFDIVLERSVPVSLRGAGVAQGGAGIRIQFPSPFQGENKRFHWGAGFSGNIVLPFTRWHDGFGVEAYFSLRIYSSVL